MKYEQELQIMYCLNYFKVYFLSVVFLLVFVYIIQAMPLMERVAAGVN